MERRVPSTSGSDEQLRASPFHRLCTSTICSNGWTLPLSTVTSWRRISVCQEFSLSTPAARDHRDFNAIVTHYVKHHQLAANGSTMSDVNAFGLAKEILDATFPALPGLQGFDAALARALRGDMAVVIDHLAQALTTKRLTRTSITSTTPPSTPPPNKSSKRSPQRSMSTTHRQTSQRTQLFVVSTNASLPSFASSDVHTRRRHNL